MDVAEAEAYELAIELCSELTKQHQRHTYRVSKLSELLVHQAQLWEKIGQTSRPKPEYFRVVSNDNESLLHSVMTNLGLLW